MNIQALGIRIGIGQSIYENLTPGSRLADKVTA